MATLAGLDALNERYYADSLVDNALLTNIVMIKLWNERRMVAGGTEIVQPVMLTVPASVGSYAGADLLNINFDQNFFGAEFPWAMYYGTIQITGEEDYKNMGPTAVVNLLESKCIATDAAVRDVVGTDIQSDGTGNGGKAILGLKAAIDDGTNIDSYGNISRAVYTNWKANLSTASANRPVTLDLITTNAWNAYRDNDRINLWATTRGVLAKLTTLLQAAQRFREDGFLADIGFENITFQGRTIVMDEHIPTSPGHIMYGLNLAYLHLLVQEARAMRYIPFQTAYAQDAAVAKILLALQMVCTQPRSQLQLNRLDPNM